ncbi:MAG: RyR domain-containing protein [Anaerolineales bacterium]
MPKPKKPTTVVVTGDFTANWYLAKVRQSDSVVVGGRADKVTRACWQRGSSALLADIIETIAAELQQGGHAPFSILQTAAPRGQLEASTSGARFDQSYTIWSLFKYGEKPPLDKEKAAWRIKEFLGLDRVANTGPEWQKVIDDTADANLVILDDGDQGFRDRPELWPLAIKTGATNRPWILLRISGTVAQGPLWDHLHGEFADRLIVVTSADDLRLTEVQISRELSWERTSQDLFWELVHNPRINALSSCAHVIVLFGEAGAVLLSREKNSSTCLLYFDPKVIEGMWEQNYPGGMIGYTTCLTAGISRQLMMSPASPDIGQGVQSGLTALRALHMEGYGERGASTSEVQLRFPIGLIASTLAKGEKPFAVAEVQDPLRFIKQPENGSEKPLTEGVWTILQDRYKENLERVAEQIVLEGPEVSLPDVPLGQFGNLLTVDRDEIESFRCLRSLVSEYHRLGQQKRPLSIAVFGSPGSGKSFGIIEVTNSVLPGQVEIRAFNLSQFNSTEDLLAAFHQVRDIALGGKIPLVFWDEFDTTFEEMPLGWLRHFLVPMQDGRFQEGQINHPLGRCIFVFAGGTCGSMASFGGGFNQDAFRAAKGPDFVSRLKGYVNILGPNPVDCGEDKPTHDPYYLIRRAILLRQIMKRNAPQLFERSNGKDQLNIDRGVLRALLHTREYRHGVRSIESIIAMSQLAGKSVFARSSLPAESQLDLHVDGLDFLALVRQIELDGAVLENLAEAAHEIYRKGVTGRHQKTDTAVLAYADLPEESKEQNRRNIRDIPLKLARAGYAMIPARSNERPFNFPGVALEMLSQAEHERWMRAKLADGWIHAAESSREKKENRGLLPWDQLPEDEKEKERDMVRGIPVILARAGYAIVKSHG